MMKERFNNLRRKLKNLYALAAKLQRRRRFFRAYAQGKWDTGASVFPFHDTATRFRHKEVTYMRVRARILYIRCVVAKGSQLQAR